MAAAGFTIVPHIGVPTNSPRNPTYSVVGAADFAWLINKRRNIKRQRRDDGGQGNVKYAATSRGVEAFRSRLFSDMTVYCTHRLSPFSPFSVLQRHADTHSSHTIEDHTVN